MPYSAVAFNMPPYSAKGIPNAKSSTVADGPLQATDIGAKMTPSEDKQGAAGTSTPNGASATLFQCSGFGDCHMVFTRSEHLARHVRYVSKTLTGRKHTGERPFKCHCHKAFSRLDNLRQHCQTVHSDTPEHNEEVLRKLTVLHSNLATSAAKNQRSFARVVSPDEYKSDEEVASPHPVHGKKWEAPSHGTSSLGHLAGMHSRAGHEEMERRYSQAAPTSAPYVPVLPPLRSKSAPHMFRSEVPAPPRTSQLGLRGASPPYSRFARTVPYMGSSGVMMRPSVSSPKASLSRDASMESSVELRPSNMLPPLSELSSRAGPRAQHDPRAHSSRSFPLPTRERSPSLSAARRASIPLVENPFHPTSPNPSYRHGYTSSKYGPPMHPDPRSASLYGPGRHGVPPYFPSPASHRSKRPESSLSTDSIESYATSHEVRTVRLPYSPSHLPTPCCRQTLCRSTGLAGRRRSRGRATFPTFTCTGR